MLIDLEHSPSGNHIRVEKDRFSGADPEIDLRYLSHTPDYKATRCARFQMRSFSDLRNLVTHAESANPELASEILGLIDRAEDLYHIAMGRTPPTTYQKET